MKTAVYSLIEFIDEKEIAYLLEADSHKDLI
jgi:hypothetical protein